MLRSGDHIRLTRREAETFQEITNFEPLNVRTEADLWGYVARCKRYYRGTSLSARFLHSLIDEHLGNCLSARLQDFPKR